MAKRKFINTTAYQLADMMAESFAKQDSDKDLIREIKKEFSYRSNPMATILKQVCSTYLANIE